MDVHTSIAAFFHEVVAEALRDQKVDASPRATVYVVQLLADYTPANVADDGPLSLRLAGSYQATPAQRLQTLREVGDTALFMSGVFADALARRLVDVEFYTQVGRTAYGALASAPSRSTADVFRELADKFGAFVSVLHQVRRGLNLGQSGNLLRLYEGWLRNGGVWLERRLRELGLTRLEAAKA